MNKTIAASALLASVLASTAFAAEGPVPTGVPPLSHVFLIMMENHGYSQIINNPNAPYTNYLAGAASLATNYFAVGHPSLTNYLEVVGGSNFGIQSDNNPDWHNIFCIPNLSSGIANTDTPASPAICPIAGTGTDAATPTVDTTNQVQGPPGLININGILSFGAAKNTVGKSIADQLAEAGLTWKSYQENLPLSGADLITSSDGVYTNLTDFTKIMPTLTPPLTSSDIVSLYASKHNPFVYFQSVQEGYSLNNTMDNVVGFTGPGGLYADLGAGTVPTFSFIAPNQCNDQHGRGNAGAFCNFDPTSDGTQAGLNPALIYQGDVTVRTLVNAIKSSPAWRTGNNVLIVVWDENDYSNAPNTNQVVVIVDRNYGTPVTSSIGYTHFSLLKSIEAGLGLPCLNHACDANLAVMSDLFGGAP
jgi:hypothetical protein